MQHNISEQIINEVSTYICEHLTEKNSIIDIEDNLYERGIIDSISLMKLLVFVETKYNINMNENDYDLDNFISINMISNFIQNKLSNTN